MSNSVSDGTGAQSTFLGTPCKLAQPVDLKKDLLELLESEVYGSAAHPEDCGDDLAAFVSLRKDVEGALEATPASLQALYRYYAHLSAALTKLPSEIAEPFLYSIVFADADAFDLALSGSAGNGLPTGSSAFAFEQSCVLFNVAAIHCQLGSLRIPNDAESVKRAIIHQQNAAGCFAKLQALSLDPVSVPDMTPAALRAFEALALAQAQEYAWQKSLLGQSTNGVISRLACEVARLYGLCLEHIADSKADPDPRRRLVWPSTWTDHLKLKQAHFSAVAQYRKSLDDGAANRYGHEISRLQEAQRLLKSVLGIRGVNQDTVGRARSLFDQIQRTLKTAQRDNDLIYLEAVPQASALPAVQPAPLAKATLPLPVSSPMDCLHDRPGGLGKPLFGSLVPFSIHLAVKLYADRKDEHIRTEVSDRVRKLDLEELDALQTMNLPASIEALERPAELPPSIIQNSEIIRDAKGPQAIAATLDDIAKLSAANSRLLNEIRQVLDEEETQDHGYRARFGLDQWTRPSSEVAAGALRVRDDALSATIDTASRSDAEVRAKWDEWADRICQLAQDPAALQASIPSSSSAAIGPSRLPGRTQVEDTRRLRRLLDELRGIHEARQIVVSEARSTGSKDDIRSIIMRRFGRLQADGTRPSDLKVADFEDLFDVELRKYQTYEEMVDHSAREQTSLIHQISDANARFLESRALTADAGAREEAFQTLDLSFQRYNELMANLEEGLKFHEGFGKLISQLLEDCRRYAYSRTAEARDLVRSLERSQSSPASVGSLAGSMSRTRLSDSSASPQRVSSPGVYDPNLHGPIRWG